MAKIKNTGNQPRGFFTEEGTHVVVQPGEEGEFNMTENDFNKLKEVLDAVDPPPYELSGSPGGVKMKTAKEQADAAAKKAEEDAKKAADEQAEKEEQQQAEKEQQQPSGKKK